MTFVSIVCSLHSHMKSISHPHTTECMITYVEYKLMYINAQILWSAVEWAVFSEGRKTNFTDLETLSGTDMFKRKFPGLHAKTEEQLLLKVV